MKEFDLKDRTKQYALRIIKLFRSLPRTPDAQVIGKQTSELNIEKHVVPDRPQNSLVK